MQYESTGKVGRRPRVLVVGAGFGGLRVAAQLRRAACDVILVDRSNHHVFQPLLYQVATAALSPADIAAPIRSIVRRQKNAQVILGTVTLIDLAEQRVFLGAEEIAWDWLVLAAGATHAYFGQGEWAARAPGLKTIDDALEVRRRVLLAFEEAELEEAPEARSAKLTFVVIGGGPTGVEMAGALREIAAQTIPDDFRRIDTTTANIVLLEGGARLLSGMSEAASDAALASLQGMGVDVRLNTYVTDLDDEAVWIGEQRVPAANVIWAAGVQGAAVAKTLDTELDDEGRVVVESDCSVPGHPSVFVIGDLAAQTDAMTGRPVPGVAQGAIQMGDFVGRIVADEVERCRSLTAVGEHPSTARSRATGSPASRPAFRYNDKGDMATIGRARAVADVFGTTFSGFVAWVLWSVIHVAFLVGFRNQLLVMVNWAWQWIVQARGARLITGNPEVRVESPVDLSADAVD